jgi:hypothetical protein
MDIEKHIRPFLRYVVLFHNIVEYVLCPLLLRALLTGERNIQKIVTDQRDSIIERTVS